MTIVSNDKNININIMLLMNKLNKTNSLLKTVTVEDYNFLTSIENDEDIFDTCFFEKQRKVHEMEIERLSNKNVSSDVEPCPRCGGVRYRMDKQTRANDEARTFFIKCGTCGLQETE